MVHRSNARKPPLPPPSSDDSPALTNTINHNDLFT